MLKIYERVDGPYRARKNEFVYQDGYPLREGRMFWLVHTKEDKLEMFIDWQDEPLISINPKNTTNFRDYKKAKSDFQREIYLKPYK